MAEFIKLSVFNANEEPSKDGEPLAGTVTYSYFRHTVIKIIQGVDDVRLPFKSCIFLDGIEEPIMVMETPEEIISARRVGH